MAVPFDCVVCKDSGEVCRLCGGCFATCLCTLDLGTDGHPLPCPACKPPDSDGGED